MRVVFMGSPDFAVPCLRALAGKHEVALVVSQPDKPAGRGAQLTPPAVKVAALELGLPIIQPKSARTGELEAALRESHAELAVVVAYGKILPKPVLDALPLGCINVHASLLPKYRGAAPIQWAVIDAEVETGVCIMQLDEGMDTGPVLLERRIPIGPEETSGELFERLAPLGAGALLDALDEIAAGRAHSHPQDHARATHAAMLTKADGAIDFTLPATKVAARIRGVDPWPGAQAKLRDQTVKLFRAKVAPGGGAPGTVLAINEAGIHVATGPDLVDGKPAPTGEGAILIRDIQAPGRKRMHAQQFAAGRGIAVGDVLSKPEIA
jgi:methionyl-tRNA formyltransferase